MIQVLTWLKGNWKAVAVVVGVAALFSAVGHLFHPKTITKTEIQTKEVSHDVVHTVTVEKPVVTYRTRTITKTVYVPGTSTPSSVTVVSEQAGSQSGGTVTQSSEVRKTQEEATAISSTSVAPEGRWSVRVQAGLSTSSGTVVGVGADYRLIGPLTVGLWTTVPLGSPSFQGGASIGLRL